MMRADFYYRLFQAEVSGGVSSIALMVKKITTVWPLSRSITSKQHIRDQVKKLLASDPPITQSSAHKRKI